MRLIDADELVARIKKISCDPCVECGRDYRCKYCEYRDFLDAIEDSPTLEDDEGEGTVKGYVEGFVQVVRCKDCKYYTPSWEVKGTRFEGDCEFHKWWRAEPTENDYCSKGERKDECD